MRAVCRMTLGLVMLSCVGSVHMPQKRPRPPRASAKPDHVETASFFDVRARLRAMTQAFDDFAAQRVVELQIPDLEIDTQAVGKTLRFYIRIIALSFLVRWFVVEPRYIPSASMAPTFNPGDQIAVEKISTLVRTPEVNEVILFRPPEAAVNMMVRNDEERAVRRGTPKTETGPKRKPEVFVKRVIAVPGDVVEIRDRAVYVNGEQLDEDFVNPNAPKYEYGPETVPEGTLFVLGDNRNRSFDSHSWGFLPTSNVVGHVILRYWPLERFGLVEH